MTLGRYPDHEDLFRSTRAARRVRGRVRVAQDFALLGAATNLARLARLGVSAAKPAEAPA